MGVQVPLRARDAPGPKGSGVFHITDEETPSDAELRIAQAQLVGWLEGLFHGIQTALFAQQVAARAQLEQMRQGALPAGIQAAQHNPGHSTGQYL